MNIQEYISSGIVESYVMGLAEEAEMAEFERMCAAHAEVRAARDAFEQSLEAAALKHAFPPPRNLKSKIFAEIEIESSEIESISINRNQELLTENEKVQTMSESRGFPRWLAAASIMLLVGSTLLNFYFYQQYKNYSGKYDELLARNTELAQGNQSLNTRLQEASSTIEKMRNPDMLQVKMPGVANREGNLATVYWDTTTKDVFLIVNKLPQPGAGKQYQLWALVDGQPVDAGVFEITAAGNTLVKMKNIPRAQAFAITLEKTGGSPAPTMTELYVLGNV